jgi:hypothetical protein
MKKLITLVIAASFTLAACGSKTKNTSTTPKADAKSGSMGGASYGGANAGPTVAPAPTPPPTSATPNPCGAGM